MAGAFINDGLQGLRFLTDRALVDDQFRFVRRLIELFENIGEDKPDCLAASVLHSPFHSATISDEGQRDHARRF